MTADHRGTPVPGFKPGDDVSRLRVPRVPLPFCAFSVRDVRRGDGPRLLSYVAGLTGKVIEDGAGRRHFPRAAVQAHAIEQIIPDHAAGRYGVPATLWAAIEAAEEHPAWSVALDVFARSYGPVDPDDVAAVADDFARRTWVREGAGVLSVIYAPAPDRPSMPSAVRFLVTLRRLGDPQLGRPFRSWRDAEVQRVWRMEWLEAWRHYAANAARATGTNDYETGNLAQIVARLEGETARLMREAGMLQAGATS